MTTITWRELHPHLRHTGTSVTVTARHEVPGDLEWTASGMGLHRFDEHGVDTATWYPDGNEVLTLAEPITLSPHRDLPALLRYAASARREYLAGAPEDLRQIVEAECATLDAAAELAEGNMRPLYGWLPSWRWTEEMQAAREA